MKNVLSYGTLDIHEEDIYLAKNINDISEFLKKVKFKKKIFGGIDELDVWNKIEKLNLEYKELYEIQQMQIDILKEKIDEK